MSRDKPILAKFSSTRRLQSTGKQGFQQWTLPKNVGNYHVINNQKRQSLWDAVDRHCNRHPDL